MHLDVPTGVIHGSRHQRYPDLAALQTGLGIDTASLVLEPEFVNLAGRDYRVKADQMTG